MTGIGGCPLRAKSRSRGASDRSTDLPVAKSYGPNDERLSKAKRQYDPDNIFCSIIPVPPATDQ